MVLMHPMRVDVVSPDPGDHTSPDVAVQFEAERRYLHVKVWRTIGIAELERDVAEGRRPERAARHDLDDGYGDQFAMLNLPILQRFGDRAVFVIGNVGKSRHLA